MTQQTMTEKDMFLKTWDREFETTMRLLRAYPEKKLDLKPAEKLRPASELIWTIVGGERMIDDIIDGQLDMAKLGAPAPKTLPEMISAYQMLHRDLTAKLQKAPEEVFNRTMKFFVAPKQMGDMRRGDVFWMSILDMIHHRGQISVYMRIAGAKVPSIYGPTADEPWD
jgi:uncharacterized damage-inducible protein DinB